MNSDCGAKVDCKGGFEARVKELEEENKQVLAQFLELQKSWQIASLEHFALTNKVSETETQLASQPQSPKQGELIEVWDEGWNDTRKRKFLCFEGIKVWAGNRGKEYIAVRYDHWRPIQPAKESAKIESSVRDSIKKYALSLKALPRTLTEETK